MAFVSSAEFWHFLEELLAKFQEVAIRNRTEG
jgi:hypothetical protein